MQERRLAAIMFTDIVGYTVLMGSDEDRAFKILRKNREIHTKFLEQYNGNLIKEMGDGMLTSFKVASDAAQCAIAIQKATKEQMDSKVRIGIHLGDITFENEDVFGDGVNIASRLQSIADPGGIYISESLQKSIRAKSEIKTNFLGEFKLKNVDYLVRTYVVLGVGLPVPSPAKIKKLIGKSWKEKMFGSSMTYILFMVLLVAGIWWGRKAVTNDPATLSSILVLPFDNFTGDDDLEYFVAGMHSSLIVDIGKISALTIKSKTTANAYKNTKKSIPEIAAELNVDAIVEASVLCLGDSVCIQVKLMSVYPEEKQLWVKDYFEAKSQIFDLYNKVTKEISEEINVVLTPQEQTLLGEARPVNTDAYDAYLKGQFYLDQIGEKTLKVAAEYFKQAMEIDPSWAAPYAGLAEVAGYQMQMGFASPQEALPVLHENLEKALLLDPNSANSYHVKAVIAVWGEWNWNKGQEAFEMAIALNPNNALSHVFYAHLLLILNKQEEAMKHCNIAIELDPLRPFVLGLAAMVKIDAGDYNAAIALCQKALEIDPNHFFAYATLELAFYKNGNYNKSLKIRSAMSSFVLEEEPIGLIQEVANKKEYNAALEQASLKLEKTAAEGAFVPPFVFVTLYLRLHNVEKAVQWIVKGYEIHDPNIPYLSARMHAYDLLVENEQYLDLLETLKLPLRP